MSEPRFVPVQYVDDNMKVYMRVHSDPLNRSKEAWTVPVKVQCAAGNSARVVNEVLGIDKWVHIGVLLVRDESVRWHDVYLKALRLLEEGGARNPRHVAHRVRAFILRRWPR